MKTALLVLDNHPSHGSCTCSTTWKPWNYSMLCTWDNDMDGAQSWNTGSRSVHTSVVGCVNTGSSVSQKSIIKKVSWLSTPYENCLWSWSRRLLDKSIKCMDYTTVRFGYIASLLWETSVSDTMFCFFYTSKELTFSKPHLQEDPNN